MDTIRKPSERWPDIKEEDLFQCIKCQEWYPWHYYRKSLQKLEQDITRSTRILCINCKPRRKWRPSDE